MRLNCPDPDASCWQTASSKSRRAILCNQREFKKGQVQKWEIIWQHKSYPDLYIIIPRITVCSLKRINLTDHNQNDLLEGGKKKKRVNNNRTKKSSLGGLEPPTFRLTAERANRLRHRDKLVRQEKFKYIFIVSLCFSSFFLLCFLH